MACLFFWCFLFILSMGNINNLDHRRLEAFCRVYELSSFSKAGKALYLSQPTISAHISSLESELGVRLFDRLRREVHPTAAGEILYGHATQAFRHLEDARQEIRLLSDEVGGELAIGASTIPAHYLLPGVLSDFAKRYPNVELKLKVGDSDSTARGVVLGELHVAVVGARCQEPDLVHKSVLTDEVILVGAPSLALDKDYSPDELCALPWVMREQGSGTRKTLEQGLNRLGLKTESLNVVLYVDTTQAVISCLRSGLGVSVTSRLAVQDMLEQGELRELNAPELSLKREFYSLHHAKRYMFPAARFFLDLLHDGRV